MNNNTVHRNHPPQLGAPAGFRPGKVQLAPGVTDLQTHLHGAFCHVLRLHLKLSLPEPAKGWCSFWRPACSSSSSSQVRPGFDIRANKQRNACAWQMAPNRAQSVLLPA